MSFGGAEVNSMFHGHSPGGYDRFRPFPSGPEAVVDEAGLLSQRRTGHLHAMSSGTQHLAAR
jgi:hypothetical protein